MKPQTLSTFVAVLVLAALLMTSGSGVVAQGPGPQGGNDVSSPAQSSEGSDQTPQTVLSPQDIASSYFTYQGQLKKSTGPVTDMCSMAFRLYDAANVGIVVAGPLTTTVSVSGGLFTVQLPFGGAFLGDDRWLDIAVKCSADSAYATLSPRQQITGAPYAFTLRPGAWVVGDRPNWNAIYASNVATTSWSYGIRSLTNAPWGRGVSGESGATGGMGVYGYSVSGGGAGVAGYIGNGNLDVYTFGSQQYGVYGMSQPVNGTGIYGTAPYTGVVGQASATSGKLVGVYGVVTSTSSPDAVGVYGVQGGGTGRYHTGGYLSSGVWGDSQNYLGVLGTSNYIGVAGTTVYTGGIGILGEAPSSGYAGYFSGNVNVIGNLSKSGGSFKIDHPLDPANKYLYHSFVESPDMKNIYDGVAVLDANGEATVALPDWFEALNRDLRYQLTCVGGYAPVYIAEEVHHNAFKIAGGRAGLKVSWQVTGIRQDAWANDHRIPVEENKTGSQAGTYLYPQGYGQPESASVSSWFVHPQGTYTTTMPAEPTPPVGMPTQP